MKVGYITNSSKFSGVGHRASKIAAGLTASEKFSLSQIVLDGMAGEMRVDDKISGSVKSWPSILGSKSINWARLGKLVPNESELYHMTNQTISFLAKRLSPAIVTVHDIIEVVEPQDKKAYLLNKYLYSGIQRADRIIAVSHHTAVMVREFYDVSEKKISVIHNGVGGDFHLIDGFEQTLGYQELRRELKIPVEAKVVLYVGSDHPRKNVIGAAQGYAAAKEKFGNVVFVKVGKPGLPAGRAALLDEIDRLKIRESVRFVGNVSLERLNEIYNLADVLIYPSKNEGFGLPPLQAMAAGTPVITSNSSSLPEVVGDDAKYGVKSALVREPEDVRGLADDIVNVLEDRNLAESLRQKGLQRAKQFSWEDAVAEVAKVYTQFGSAK